MIDKHGIFHIILPSDAWQKSLYISPLADELKNFILLFQTECVVECCGIDAFAFPEPTPEDNRWIQDAKMAQLLEIEIVNAKNFNAEIVVVKELNQLMSKEDWLLLLRRLLDGLQIK